MRSINSNLDIQDENDERTRISAPYTEFESSLVTQIKNQIPTNVIGEPYKELIQNLNLNLYFHPDRNTQELLRNIKVKYSGMTFSDKNIKFSKLIKVLLRCLDRVEFLNCIFKSEFIDRDINTYFEKCIFEINHWVEARSEIENDQIYHYIQCTFLKDVLIIPSELSKKIYFNVFKSCFFYKDIYIRDLTFEKSLFYFTDPLYVLDPTHKKIDCNLYLESIKKEYRFNYIKIINCVFESDFKLNGLSENVYEEFRKKSDNIDSEILKVGFLNIINTKFKGKFEVKFRHLDQIKFLNSNVDLIFDLFESEFLKANFDKCIFSDFAGFEDVRFGSEREKSNEEFLTIFKYVTFMDFSSFRSARFNSGLDFSKTNLKDTPNFLDVHISPENTDRETFRIVKKSFDDAGNKIEANRFFVKEMNAYQRELIKTRDKEVRHIKNLKNSGKKNEVKLYKNSKGYKSSQRARWVFNINSFTSEFGGNYVRPISILFFLAIIYTSITLWHEWYFKSHEYFMSWKWFDVISKPFNEFAINILPFRIFIKDRSGIEFISLIFYILFAILIWQIVVSVKRHTQR